MKRGGGGVEGGGLGGEGVGGRRVLEEEGSWRAENALGEGVLEEEEEEEAVSKPPLCLV